MGSSTRKREVPGECPGYFQQCFEEPWEICGFATHSRRDSSSAVPQADLPSAGPPGSYVPGNLHKRSSNIPVGRLRNKDTAAIGRAQPRHAVEHEGPSLALRLRLLRGTVHPGATLGRTELPVQIRADSDNTATYRANSEGIRQPRDLRCFPLDGVAVFFHRCNSTGVITPDLIHGWTLALGRS